VTLNPDNQTELRSIAYVLCVLACRNYAVPVEHCFWVLPDLHADKKIRTGCFIMFSLVTSWLCDETCVWRVDRWRVDRV